MLGAAGLVGCTDEGPPPAPPRAVGTVTVAPRAVQPSSRYSGSLEPRERVDLNFRVGGRVRALGEVGEGASRRPIQEGDRVVRGQWLASLDESDLKLHLRAAAAGERSSAAQVAAAKNALALADKEVARARALFATHTITKAEYDRAESGLAAAQANLEGALSQRLAKAEQRALARSTVADARLRSPISGILARRMVDVGESVAPGMVAFTVIDTSEMRVVFGVPDTKVNALRPGDRVPVRIDALPGGALAGTVTKVSPIADPQLRSFLVEVAVPNPEGELRAGMVASVAVETAALPEASLVPLSAIVRGPEGKGYAVYVLANDGGTVALRGVELLDLWGNEVEVAKGLAAGDRVVVEGARLLHDGEAVEALP